MCVLVAQLCPTLCNPMDCSPPGSSVHGIFQARILEWVAIVLSRVSSWPRNQTQVSHITGRFFTIWATRPDDYTFLKIPWNSLARFSLYITHIIFCSIEFCLVVCACVHVCFFKTKLNVTQLCPAFVTPWIIPSMEFSRPEYWSG